MREKPFICRFTGRFLPGYNLSGVFQLGKIDRVFGSSRESYEGSGYEVELCSTLMFRSTLFKGYVREMY